MRTAWRGTYDATRTGTTPHGLAPHGPARLPAGPFDARAARVRGHRLPAELKSGAWLQGSSRLVGRCAGRCPAADSLPTALPALRRLAHHLHEEAERI